ncbi:hypothetical protein HK102_013682 [Quaeritorhiza haematococci]|nr:hypothetical protein HK102_013682 [Quaeritorhiza haematococci]
MDHCWSLEALVLVAKGSEFKDGCVELVKKRGGTMKILELTLPWNDESVLTHADDLVRSIADCCPNLEQLYLPGPVDLYVPEKIEQSESNATNDAISGTDVREQTFAKLVNQCKHLYQLTVGRDFDWDGFSDPKLKAKVHGVVHGRKVKWTDQYYDYRFYEGRSCDSEEYY